MVGKLSVACFFFQEQFRRATVIEIDGKKCKVKNEVPSTTKQALRNKHYETSTTKQAPSTSFCVSCAVSWLESFDREDHQPSDS
jgi:hypothetical protein